QITGGRVTFPSPWATASGVFLAVIARPNGAAIISEEQNCRKARRLMPHRIRRSSMLSRALEEATSEPSMRSLRPFRKGESQPYATPVRFNRDFLFTLRF